MDVSVTPQIDDFVKQQVESGAYRSASEVVGAGLRLLIEQDRRNRLKELRAKVTVGLEQADRGEVAALDIEQIKIEGRRRLAEIERAERSEES